MKENKKSLIILNSVIDLILAIVLAVFVDYNMPLCMYITVVVVGLITNYAIGRKLAKLAPKRDIEARKYFSTCANHLWFLLPGIFALDAVAMYADHYIFNANAAVDFMPIILASLTVTLTMCLPMVAMFVHGLSYLPSARRIALFKDRMNENLALALKLMAVDIAILLILAISVLSALWLPNDGILSTHPVIVTAGGCATILVMTLGYAIKGWLVRKFTLKQPKKLQLAARRVYTRMSLVSMFILALVVVTILYSIVFFGESLEWSRLIDILAPLSLAFALPLIAYIAANHSNE